MPVSITLFFSAVSCVIFFVLGGIIGWVGNDVVFSLNGGEAEEPFDHPEMYDSKGRAYTGELLSLTFEDYEEEDEA
jgi:hypothetical protein|tara:strand:- start:568 stop:795 length:228 start_codon:yes stop_codon:yes gene_type:complete